MTKIKENLSMEIKNNVNHKAIGFGNSVIIKTTKPLI